jgi:hypothetical protein
MAKSIGPFSLFGISFGSQFMVFFYPCPVPVIHFLSDFQTVGC